MTDALRLENVRKVYGDVVAVDNVSFEVAPGELFALLGPSGCGKTSTLRMIAGLVRPTSGTIYIQDRVVNAIPVHRRRIAMVFQSYALFPHLTVWQNVAFGLEMQRVAKREIGERVEAALGMVRLGHLQQRYPRELSGGEQQRVAFARSAAASPSVLLLDEPLGALDRRLRDDMQVELRQLQRQLGVATILVTHDQEEALTLSDRIAVMNRGRIVQIGSPAEIYERPADAFVANFIGVTNLLAGEILEQRDGQVVARTSGGSIVRASSSRDWAIGAQVSLALRPERVSFAEHGEPDTHEAIIEHAVYLGSGFRVHARLNGADRVIVLHQNRPSLSVDLREGVSVHLTWRPEDLRIFER